ncbi:hypothetical protein OESDEN_18846 [Oesophagostomum dentatum]|uniref:Uncharacterized protein n=1 Tax=Oesophagostomum dentatum TaxID=61180 RepID=A0A0B1S822_OESDE|nr:hypothetical protein OESDEN_18846 [Oesophagostomum dentatum]
MHLELLPRKKTVTLGALRFIQTTVLVQRLRPALLLRKPRLP